MATMLDVSFLGTIMPIWIFILVFAIVYALLNVTKATGDNRNIQAIIALVVAIASVLSSRVVSFISVFIPWIVVFFIFIVFMIVAFRIFQGDVTHIKFPFPKMTTGWIILIFMLIIGFGSLASIVGQDQVAVTEGGTTRINESTSTRENVPATGTAPAQTTDYGTRLGSAFYHPKVLGFLLIILLAVFAMMLLTTTPNKIGNEDEGGNGHH